VDTFLFAPVDLVDGPAAVERLAPILEKMA
jgi:hypothetical protein